MDEITYTIKSKNMKKKLSLEELKANFHIFDYKPYIKGNGLYIKVDDKISDGIKQGFHIIRININERSGANEIEGFPYIFLVFENRIIMINMSPVYSYRLSNNEEKTIIYTCNRIREYNNRIQKLLSCKVKLPDDIWFHIFSWLRYYM